VSEEEMVALLAGNPLPPPTRRGLGEVRSGDWLCQRCGVNNYASRHKCFQCFAGKGGGGGDGRGIKDDKGSGDLSIASTGDMKDDVYGRTDAGEIRSGDWPCPGCGVNNFASRQKCFQCGALPLSTLKTPSRAARTQHACRLYRSASGCHFGDRCSFLHAGSVGSPKEGSGDSGNVKAPPLCRSFKTSAGCSYGDSCMFVHEG